jgi:hypothetical protein
LLPGSFGPLLLRLPAGPKDNEEKSTGVLETWKHDPQNLLMYHPKDAPLTPAEQVRLAKAATREIVHDNTRITKGITLWIILYALAKVLVPVLF